MLTLFGFFELFRKHKKNKRISLFETTESLQCDYLYSEIYLGTEAKVIFAEGQFETRISYSVRDGILVKIKRNNPYKILYEYIDGRALVLDEKKRGYAELTEKLNILKVGCEKRLHLEVYNELENEVYNFLIREFNSCRS